VWKIINSCHKIAVLDVDVDLHETAAAVIALTDDYMNIPRKNKSSFSVSQGPKISGFKSFIHLLFPSLLPAIFILKRNIYNCEASCSKIFIIHATSCYP
jgi:hypothetical protein